MRQTAAESLAIPATEILSNKKVDNSQWQLRFCHYDKYPLALPMEEDGCRTQLESS
jgi:hypothetical protein